MLGRPSRFRSWHAACAGLLLLSFVCGRLALERQALRAAEDLGQRTGKWLALFKAAGATAGVAPPPALEPLPADASQAALDDASLASAPASKPRRGRASPPAAAAPKHGIFVSAAQVLALVRRGVQPVGHPVAASSRQPAGLQLANVAALGIGLRDGDILTEVAGSAVRAPAQVIGAVLAARAKHATSISGKFWRAGETWQLVVQQPYPERALPEAASREATQPLAPAGGAMTTRLRPADLAS